MKIDLLLLVSLVLLSACSSNGPTSVAVPPTETLVPSITPQPLTPTHTMFPTLSGSGGGVLAYSLGQPSGRMQIHWTNLDGTADRQLPGLRYGVNHMDWSPDGQRFVAVVYMDSSFTTWSIHIFGFDGSDPVRLTDTLGAADSEPAWSPDGTRILFTRVSFTSGSEFTNQVMVMNADGSDQHVIVEDGFAAKWSPDGDGIIYSSGRTGNHELYTANADGTGEQRLTDTLTDESYPSWSPDGTRMVFTSSTGEWNSIESQPTYEVFVMDADGTGLRQLTANQVYDGTPRWSPDGTQIVFSSGLAGEGLFDVFVMDVDGTDVRQVTHVPAGARAINPVWMP